MKDTHETQLSNRYERDIRNGKVFSPTEDLENIAGGGPLNNEGLENVSRFPKGIKYMGYVLFGIFGVLILLGITLSYFN
ncbi:hypothetical protein [Bacillus sp. SJS]|uniref:hypothetical protein n=1 Tax=Bacillus sp. SJS TaxID=1423321 RepID=UPI0004DD27DD|nr:hypothetical protein [Bacillus sp. SJS]KZZ84710.1 hypothetical protein AS29_009255 [Bacillus sp. SJS]